MMMVSSRSQINTRCSEKNRYVMLTSWTFMCMCVRERKINIVEKYWSFSTLCECVFTSMSESRGGAGSLTLFLPLSFPSDPLRAGIPSSLPGVGGLGGGWYSPGTHTHTPIKQINTFINWFLQVLQFTCWIEKNTKMSWIMGSVGFRVFGATPGPKIWDISEKQKGGLSLLTCVWLWAVIGQHDRVFWMLIG